VKDRSQTPELQAHDPGVALGKSAGERPPDLAQLTLAQPQ
jgi:hypothetical protein